MYQKSKQLISEIQELEGDTLPLPGFFTVEELNQMLLWSKLCLGGQYGKNSYRLQDQNAENNDQTGSPQGSLKQEICHFLSERMTPIINKNKAFELEFDVAFHANKKPYGIHTDSGYDPEEFIYKQGIIPLQNEPGLKKTHTVIMNQKCYHSSSFPNISEDLEAQKQVHGLEFSPMPKKQYDQYWKNCDLRKKQMLGFTVDYPFEWQVGDTIVWDRSRVHCSSDFEATGVEYKLGLMWISRLIRR